jgi:hypothetical protein
MTPAQTDQRSTAQEIAGRVVLWTGKWSIGRRVAVFVVGLLQQFFHAGFFRMVLVPGYEWLVPMDPFIYLLTEAIALATSFGLLALPFLKVPGRSLRVVVMASLALGAFANAARLVWGVYAGDFWFAFVCKERGFPGCNLLKNLLSDLWVQVLFAFLLFLNSRFFLRMRGG